MRRIVRFLLTVISRRWSTDLHPGRAYPAAPRHYSLWRDGARVSRAVIATGTATPTCGRRALNVAPKLLIARSSAAALITLVVMLTALGIAVIGQGQYVDDYCITRVPAPKGMTEATGGGRPAYLDNPITIRCDYDHFPSVTVTDLFPLFWIVGTVGTATIISALLWRTMVIRPWRTTKDHQRH